MIGNWFQICETSRVQAIMAQQGMLLGRYSDATIAGISTLPGWDGEVARLEMERRKDLDS